MPAERTHHGGLLPAARAKPSPSECEDARVARTQGAWLAPASESTEDAASRCARSLRQVARAGIEPDGSASDRRRRFGQCQRRTMARAKPSSLECEDARVARTQGAWLAPASE